MLSMLDSFKDRFCLISILERLSQEKNIAMVVTFKIIRRLTQTYIIRPIVTAGRTRNGKPRPSACTPTANGLLAPTWECSYSLARTFEFADYLLY